MKIFFADGGFYHEGVQLVMPEGAVEISQAQHRKLLAAHAIRVDKDGVPHAVKAPAVEQTEPVDLLAYVKRLEERISELENGRR